MRSRLDDENGTRFWECYPDHFLWLPLDYHIACHSNQPPNTWFIRPVVCRGLSSSHLKTDVPAKG